jgi:hypothetical protein
MINRVLGAVALLGMAVPALADGEPQLNATQKMMLEPVHKQALEGAVLKLLKPEEALRLMLMARFKAGSIMCEDIGLDERKIVTHVNDLTKELSSLVEPGQMNFPLVVVWHGYATMTGGEIAAAAQDRDSYCALVKALAEKGRGSEKLDVLK